MLDAYLPDKRNMKWEKNETHLHVRFANASLLRILGSDKFDDTRGIDSEGVVIDEWSLVKPAAWYEVFRPIIALSDTRWAMFLWTPKGENHATEEQARRKTWPEWYCETLRASESGIIPADQLAKAKLEMPATLFDQEFECAHITDEEMTLITSRMVDNLNGHVPVEPLLKKIIAVDPALGGDNCVAMYFENTKVVEKRSFQAPDTNVIIGQLCRMSNDFQCNNFIVDSCGMGKPISDFLGSTGKYVQYFNSAQAASDAFEAKKRFANKKAEAWWYASTKIQDREVEYPEDIELRRQIPVASRYKVTTAGGKIRMQLKADIKKVLGHSPDEADCWCYGLWGLRNVESEGKVDYNTKSRHHSVGVHLPPSLKCGVT